MAYIDFHPVDYIDEISTKDLERELKDRKDRSTERGRTIEEIVSELRDAFYQRKASEFEHMLTLLERDA